MERQEQSLRRFSDIKHAIYINLDTRPDRRAEFEEHFKNLHVMYPNEYSFFPITRFSAIKHECGAIGCSKSHIECIRFAKQHNWNHVLIMEDDTLIKYPAILSSQVTSFLSSFQDNWDVVLFSGNNYPPFKVESPYCFRIANCQTTGCYLISSRYYDTLLDNFQEGVAKLEENPKDVSLYAVDAYWKKLQRRDRWFLITPICVIQRPGFSDIENHYVNYEKLMLDLVKKSPPKR
jgi:glycosyl transferase family 25